ncbi:hypothetical protein T439DRAFT_45746 [Meredithblackwellia eburnea MCA 4105]
MSDHNRMDRTPPPAPSPLKAPPPDSETVSLQGLIPSSEQDWVRELSDTAATPKQQEEADKVINLLQDQDARISIALCADFKKSFLEAKKHYLLSTNASMSDEEMAQITTQETNRGPLDFNAYWRSLLTRCKVIREEIARKKLWIASENYSVKDVTDLDMENLRRRYSDLARSDATTLGADLTPDEILSAFVLQPQVLSEVNVYASQLRAVLESRLGVDQARLALLHQKVRKAINDGISIFKANEGNIF